MSEEKVMTPQDILDAAKEIYVEWWNEDRPDEDLNLGERRAYIKGRMEERAIRCKESDGWISVEDMLPELYQSVMFVVVSAKEQYNGKVYGGVYTSGGLFSCPGIGFNASHWKPLPQPPAIPNKKQMRL